MPTFPWKLEATRKATSLPENDLLDLDTTEHNFKVVIIGDSTVGKTSFVHRYVEGTFLKNYKGTVGVDFALKVMKLSNTESVKLQLWDIAGQERFAWMSRVYYKGAHGAVLMFDLNNRRSFLNCLKWKEDIDSKCLLNDGKTIPCMLLANKCDLVTRQVNQMEIEHIYKDYGFVGWTEVSTKEGLMVTDSMQFLVTEMMKNLPIQPSHLEDSIVLGTKEKQKSKCRLC